MRIATLGPMGTFSHTAVLRYNKKAKIVFEKTAWDIFESVESGAADVGIVPIENSVSGSVGLTLDALLNFDLAIIKEDILPVKHNLAGFGKMEDIKKIYVQEHTYAQCERFLRKNFKDAVVIETTSNGESAERLLKSGDKTRAAIVPGIAVDIYKLKILKSDIQDNKFNITRFLAVSKKSAKRTGHDRTSIMICPQTDRPGILYYLLGEFAKRKINLTKIESRPAKGKLGDYIFFIDMEGHKDDKKIKDAFNNIEKHFFLKILGSYKRAY